MIEIKVTGDQPMEAMSSLVGLAMFCRDSPRVAEAADQLYRDKKTVDASVYATTAPKVSPSQQPITASVPVATTVQKAPVAPTVPLATAPGYTHAQVGKAGADLIATNSAALNQLTGLLQQFGVQAITELKADQLGAFATALRGLGAKL